ncbi:MAG: hypothetical protein AAFR23_04150 [Pseudomonadota bacterium]
MTQLIQHAARTSYVRRVANVGFAVVISALVSALAVVPSADARLDCVRDWTVASRIVEREALAGVQQLAEHARAKENASVVRTMLCKNGDTYVYRVVMRDRRGRLQTKTVDARDPFGRASETR